MKSGTFHQKEFTILFNQRVLGILENVFEIGAGKLVEYGDHGETADKFGNHTKVHKVLRLRLAE